MTKRSFLFTPSPSASFVEVTRGFRALSLLFLLMLFSFPLQARKKKELPGNPAVALIDESQRSTLQTIQRCLDNGRLYRMEYQNDYYLDELLDSHVASLQNLVEYAASRLIKPDIPLKWDAGTSCTSFTARTEEGDVLFCRNYDFRHDPTAALLFTHPSVGHRSVGISDVAWIGYKPGSLDDGTTDISALMTLPYITIDGMNERGVAISVMMLHIDETSQKDSLKRDIMTTSAIRLALDRASSVDDVIELWQQFNMHSAVPGSDFHFLVADPSGRTVVLEYCHGELNVIETPFVANLYLNPTMGQDPLSCPRYRIVKELLDYSKGIMTEQDAMRALSEVRQGGKRGKTPTQWSAVYNLTKRTVTVAMGGDYEHLFTTSLYPEQ